MPYKLSFKILAITFFVSENSFLSLIVHFSSQSVENTNTNTNTNERSCDFDKGSLFLLKIQT